MRGPHMLERVNIRIGRRVWIQTVSFSLEEWQTLTEPYLTIQSGHRTLCDVRTADETAA